TLPDPPISPSDLMATTLSSSSVRLDWDDNSFNETYFDIEQSLSPSTGFVLIDSVSTNFTSYIVTNLNPSSYYFYRVRARNSGGYSSYSNYAMGITNTTPPSAPSFLTIIEKTSSQVKLSWTDNSFNETNFVLQRATGTGGSYTTIAEPNA